MKFFLENGRSVVPPKKAIMNFFSKTDLFYFIINNSIKLFLCFYIFTFCVSILRRISATSLYRHRNVKYTLHFVFFFFFFFYYRSTCIIDHGASRRRTRNARFRDHSTTSMCGSCLLVKSCSYN